MDTEEIVGQVTRTAERAGWNERRIELLESSLAELYNKLEESNRRIQELNRRVEELEDED